MVHPWSVALWPMVTSEPTDSGTPGSACKRTCLHVAALADGDGVTVGAEHGSVPDARLTADGDASNEHGTRSDEGGSGDVGAISGEGDN